MNSEKFYRALEGIKENQIEPKNTITEMKNTLEGVNVRLNDTEELPDRRSMPAGLTLQSVSPQSLQGKTVSTISLFTISCVIYVLHMIACI